VITGKLTVPELAEVLVAQDTEIVKILAKKGMAVNTQSLHSNCDYGGAAS